MTRKYRFLFLIYFFVFVFFFTILVGFLMITKKDKNQPDIGISKVIPFFPGQIKLLDGPFKHATELDEQTLLNYSPDRFLAKFRIEAGLKPKAESYKGWEGETIAGHSLGHYLSACSHMYQTTGNPEFLKRVKYIVDELEICQSAGGDGYIGAVPGAKKIFEEEIAKGNIRSKGFDLNGIWAPIYTQHKELAGLLDAYELTDNKKALVVATHFADWIGNYVSKLNDDQLQLVMNCEHGGINESMAELFSLTRDKKYLNLAEKFYHKDILTPLSEGKDILAGTHANTQIPKLIGLARIYELTGDAKMANTAKFFWDRVVHHHSYVTGGNCNHEYFGPSDSLRNRLSENTTESCNVYNMLKLTGHLFSWEPTAELADYYERALFNHILSSQHPINGKVIYNLSLDMGGKKNYEDPDSFTCCVGTGMENHAKYGENIYYHSNSELYASQFISSVLNWEEKGIVLTQLTQFPNEQATTFKFDCKKPVMLDFKVRYPYWAQSGITIEKNGKNIPINQKPGSFITLSGMWNTGDNVKISIPFSIRTESMPDDSNRIAIMYGPLVLAGDLGKEDDPNAYSIGFVPIILTTDRNPSDWMSQVKGKANTFVTNGIGNPRDIVLKPFYEIHDRRYSVYFDLFTKESWNKFQMEYQTQLQEKKQLEKKTIDFFQPGEMQPERDHDFQLTKGWIEYLRDRKGRMADRGGEFSFMMKVSANNQNTLWVEYWGGYTGSKTFDILIDGEYLATENISEKKPGYFFDAQYPIPEKQTLGKDQIRVTFNPHEGHRAGPVFGVRTIKKI
jgi:uncharacterized protein